MAEALGADFYGDVAHAPVMERLAFVADFIAGNGDEPTTHLECGARGAFPTIISNGIRYATGQPAIANEVVKFGAGVATMPLVARAAQLWTPRNFSGWSPEVGQQIVEKSGGTTNVTILETDPESANHGHNEFIKVRLWTPGIAFSANDYIEDMQRSEDPLLKTSNAFSNNDDRVWSLAQMIAKDSESQSLAFTAGLLYSEAGWATLGKGQYSVKVEDVTARQAMLG